MNEYRTFSFVFHKMLQCWADWPVCFLDEVPTAAEVSSASHSTVTEVLLPLALYLAVVANTEHICNSSQIFPLNKFSLKKIQCFSELTEWREHRWSSRGETVNCHISFNGAKGFLGSWFCPVLVWSTVGHLVCQYQERWCGGHLKSGISSARPFWKAPLQEDQSRIGEDQITGSDCFSGTVAEAQLRAVAWPQQDTGDCGCWEHCPALIFAAVPSGDRVMGSTGSPSSSKGGPEWAGMGAQEMVQ